MARLMCWVDMSSHVLFLCVIFALCTQDAAAVDVELSSADDSPFQFLEDDAGTFVESINSTPELAEMIEDKASLAHIFDQELDIEKQQEAVQEDSSLTAALLVPESSEVVAEAASAEFKVIDVSSGSSKMLQLEVGARAVFQDLIIDLTRCVTETKISLVPVHKAYLNIKTQAGAEVFRGWIFSQYRFAAQPAYQRNFFTLSSCKITK